MSTNWLKSRRESLGMTQSELASKLTLRGLVRQTNSISVWESGDKVIPLLGRKEDAIILAECLEWSLEELLAAAFDIEVFKIESGEELTRFEAETLSLLRKCSLKKQEAMVTMIRVVYNGLPDEEAGA